MKKRYLILIIFLYVLIIPSVYASTKKAMLTGNEVSLRSGPGTNYSIIASLGLGTVYELSSEELYTNEKGCSNGWYKIIYNSSTTGYVCSSYISIITESTSNGTPSTDCEKELSDLGFPSSYWSGLCALKESHSNWNFKPIITNIDWSTAVEEESQCGMSYISTSNSEYIDSSCTNKYTSSWYPASQKALAYYMDPRNWFDEKYIFQFEYLMYDSSLSSVYPNGVYALLKNASFYTYHSSISNDLSQIINTAGSNSSVSPIFLSTRMLQELGTSTSEYDLYSGVYTGYDNAYYGYYNFFNYGVNDSCATTYGIAYCGLSVAKTLNWNSPLTSIQGTSTLLASSYISAGQYTTYLQKFNVVPTNQSKLFNHQYMTNVAAPSSESKSTYNTYKSLNILDLGYTFYIPVYINMDNEISNSGNGGSNETTNTSTSMSVSEVVSTGGFRYSKGYISGISANTDVSTVKSSIEAIGGSVTIKDTNNKTVTSGNIGTGFKIVINASSTEELTVIVKGDTSGDGEITALDLLQIQKQLLGTYSLSEAGKQAADTSKDNSVTALDLLQVQKQLLGTYNIER